MPPKSSKVVAKSTVNENAVDVKPKKVNAKIKQTKEDVEDNSDVSEDEIETKKRKNLILRLFGIP